MSGTGKNNSENAFQPRIFSSNESTAVPLSDATNLPDKSPKKESTSWLSWALPSFFSADPNASTSQTPVLSTALSEEEPENSNSLPTTPTAQRPDGPKPRKRRVSTANKAEPLVKKLWKKKERERLMEIDSLVRELCFQIDQTEIAYRRALRAKNSEACDDLMGMLTDLMHQKVAYSRERLDIKARIGRARAHANGSYSV